ncbi:WD40 repeat protein [Coemansia aciculifera]|uniref:WD40 repeat protein n=1 Tax=Coemansia aciculifera TaxID=417176 RepID=A0ACC1MA01_9FUNG|nr:WD40 repeat protein [Coemansia aciculifera]
MYWRIDCTERLLLKVHGNDDDCSRKIEVAPKTSRPRSTTFSAGSISSGNKEPLLDEYSGNGVVVRWAGTSDGHLLAGVTRQGIYLWSVKPFVQLSKLVYDAVDELGQFVDVVWGGGGSNDRALFAVTSTGFIYEIAVYEREGPALEFQFKEQHYYVRGPGEAEGIASLGLAQKRTYRLPSNASGGSVVVVVCAARVGDDLALVCTRTHVFRLTWAGEVESTVLVRDIYDNPLAQVQQVLRVPSKDDGEWTELYLFSDGSVHALCFDGSVRQMDQGGSGGFTVLAYNGMARIVAAGTAQGEVVLWQGAELEELARWARREEEHVAALAWTADGAALACAYATGCVAMRSVLGFELNATRIEGSARHSVAVARTLHWGAGSTRLLVLSDSMALGNRRCGQQADVLPFARLGGWAAAGRVCVYSDDKVFLHSGDFSGSGGGGGGGQGAAWMAAHVPADYLAANWPLRHVAASDDGLHVAVAGSRGVACYGAATHRWRLFRSRQAEAAIACACLAWCGAWLVAAVETSAGEPQLQFFGRGRGPLDDAVAAVGLAAPAVVLSSHDSLLLVLCADAVVYQYAVFEGSGGEVSVTLRRAVSLAASGVDPRRVRSLQWVPSAQFDARPQFLVLEGTALRVVGPGSGSGSATRVTGRAEFSITSAVNFGSMHSTVWWFSGSHLCAELISLDDFMDDGGRVLGSSEGASSPRLMRIRPEFYPVAVSPDRGMAVGIDQDDGVVAGFLPVRAKLYLPNMLEHMLVANGDRSEQDALLYAACFEHYDFFPHAMEILLHSALEQQHRSDVLLLPRVVALLENFAKFREIVVHCARKTEAALWPLLFECLGGPESFFQQCLAAGELETATQSLIILQTLEPASVNDVNILRLLRLVDEAKMADLAVEILRFLKMTAESDTTMKLLLTRLRKQK